MRTWECGCCAGGYVGTAESAAAHLRASRPGLVWVVVASAEGERLDGLLPAFGEAAA